MKGGGVLITLSPIVEHDETVDVGVDSFSGPLAALGEVCTLKENDGAWTGSTCETTIVS